MSWPSNNNQASGSGTYRPPGSGSLSAPNSNQSAITSTGPRAFSQEAQFHLNPSPSLDFNSGEHSNFNPGVQPYPSSTANSNSNLNPTIRLAQTFQAFSQQSTANEIAAAQAEAATEATAGNSNAGSSTQNVQDRKGKGKAKQKEFSTGDPNADLEMTEEMLEAIQAGQTQHPDEEAAAILAIEEAAKQRMEISEQQIAESGIEPTIGELTEDVVPTFGSGLQHSAQEATLESATPQGFFERLGPYLEVMTELAKHLDMKSFVHLFAISKDFYNAINGHMTHCMLQSAKYRAPESFRIFRWNLYENLAQVDTYSEGRPRPRQAGKPRYVPSLRWLQMIVHRERVVRDILALMARSGHRMPKGMSLSLKKMWLLMDIATTARRVQVMHAHKYFTAWDLYNIQMFIIKLDLRFNDPNKGAGDDTLRKLMLGQRGLTPLRDLLKRTRFTEYLECLRLLVRYRYTPARQDRHLSIFDVPPHEIGIGHLEGWGKGRVHLMRPDELVVREALRRKLDLKNHLLLMMLWGYIDPKTGKNTPPTEEEMYMSEDENEDTDNDEAIQKLIEEFIKVCSDVE